MTKSKYEKLNMINAKHRYATVSYNLYYEFLFSLFLSSTTKTNKLV